MIPQIGIAEIAIVLIIALIVFGPRKLPDLGRSLGRGLREFREGVSSISASVEGSDEDDHVVDELPETSHPEVVVPSHPQSLEKGRLRFCAHKLNLIEATLHVRFIKSPSLHIVPPLSISFYKSLQDDL